MMEHLNQQLFTGERALFKGKDLQISHSVFADGESPLKESNKISYCCIFENGGESTWPVQFEHSLKRVENSGFM